MLEWITIAAAALGGYLQAPALVIPLAAFALIADGVVGKAWQLRRHPSVPLTSKMITYLVTGAVGALGAAWLAYLAGGLCRQWL